MLSKADIEKYLEALNDELRKKEAIGELYMVGGAVMCLVFNARESTKDIDAIFAPKDIINECASIVASDYNLSNDWLNDAVKGFASDKGSFDSYVEYSNLRVFTAIPEYLLRIPVKSNPWSEHPVPLLKA